MEKYRLLFESVFKKQLTGDDAVNSLQQVAAEHPYFSIAQFYLLQLTQKGTRGYSLQAKRTAALFNNNYWLNFQLLEAGAADVPPVQTSDEEDLSFYKPAADLHSSTAETTETVAPDAPGETVKVPATEEEAYAVNDVFKTNADFAGDVIPVTEATGAPDEPLVDIDTTGENETTHVKTEDAEPVEAIPAVATAVEAAEVSLPAAEPSSDAYNSIDEQYTGDTIAVPGDQVEAPVQAPVQTVEKESDITDENPADLQQAEVAVAEETAPGEKDGELGITNNANEIAVVQETQQEAEYAPALPESKEQPAETIKEPLLFEPLHTSDYFASVGIKLSEEEKTADKLGKQLRSFTDWLKTMKKVHARELSTATRPAEVELSGAEGNIQQLAEKSNREDEVLTEAMADVLEQQGRRQKAVEILEKLSLLNPSKNAYFAAKINQIKEK